MTERLLGMPMNWEDCAMRGAAREVSLAETQHN